MALAATIYHVWKERNARVFQNKAKTVTVLLRMIVQEIHARAGIYPKLARVLQDVTFDYNGNHLALLDALSRDFARKNVGLEKIDSDVINIIERSFEGPLNSLPIPPRCPIVDDNLNDYENDDDHPINIEDDFMHMEDVSSDSQDAEDDCGMRSQQRHSFANETNFYCDQIFVDKKELKMLLDGATARQSSNSFTEKRCTKLLKAKYVSRGCS
ncbi:hypothetical protein BC332_19082 [Capsicum chinense]|nr:hypothetical protein BC332_19082 [Capsicum chinense]